MIAATLYGNIGISAFIIGAYSSCIPDVFSRCTEVIYITSALWGFFSINLHMLNSIQSLRISSRARL